MNQAAINGILSVCERHANRIRWAITKMTPLMPMTPKKFETLKEEEVSYLEVFTTRFSKLQDAPS